MIIAETAGIARKAAKAVKITYKNHKPVILVSEKSGARWQSFKPAFEPVKKKINSFPMLAPSMVARLANFHLLCDSLLCGVALKITKVYQILDYFLSR
jgi:hypothetical protein